jgi:YegS/Rv2252/BmrU family lipid kinase
LTEGREDAWHAVRTMGPDVDLVVAVGGDGTVREVLSGLVDPEVAVGMLPMGTANVMARELGLPRDVDAVLEVLARGRVSALDVMDVNGELSFLVTGIGLDGMAVRDVEQRRRGPITKWSYVEAVARTLLQYEPPALSVELDGRKLDGTSGLVLVSNTVNYGGILTLDPLSRIDDGQVEAYLFPRGTRLELLRGALTGFLSHLPGGACESYRVRRVRVDAASPVPYQSDGDFRGHVPVEIRVAPVQYRLVVP